MLQYTTFKMGGIAANLIFLSTCPIGQVKYKFKWLVLTKMIKLWLKIRIFQKNELVLRTGEVKIPLVLIFKPLNCPRDNPWRRAMNSNLQIKYNVQENINTAWGKYLQKNLKIICSISCSPAAFLTVLYYFLSQ